MSVPALTPLDTPIFDEDVLADMEEHADDVVPCQITACEAAAEWSVVSRCCGFQAVYCDQHKRALIARANDLLPLGWGCKCESCGHMFVLVRTADQIWRWSRI